MPTSLPRPPPATGPGDWTDYDAMDPMIGPIDLSAWFVMVDTNPPPIQEQLSGVAGTITREKLLGSLSTGTAAALDGALTNEFSQVFDNTWQQSIPSIKDQIQKTLFATDPGNVSITEWFLPEKGTLRGAIRSTFSPDMQALYPASVQGGQLDLIYRIVGLGAKFHSHKLDLFLKIWVKIKISIGFPHATNAGVQVITTTTEMPDVEGDGALNSIILSIGSLLGQFDDPPWSTSISQSGGFGDSLKAGFTLAAQTGFLSTRISPIDGTTVDIPSGLTVKALTIHIDLEHPIDSAPTVLPPPPYLTSPAQDLIAPEIQLDRYNAYPKDTVNIRGLGWVFTGWDRYIIHCKRATSGIWRRTELQAGIILPGQTTVQNPTTTEANHDYPNSNDDYFTVMSGLNPGTHIGYRYREYDLPDFIATQWTPWTDAFTSTTNEALFVTVEITLDGGTPYPMTTSVIEVQPDGSIEGTFELPARAPNFTPGQHQIIARLELASQVSASVNFTVNDDSGAAAPQIQLVNLFNVPNGSAMVPAQIIPGTQYLRGYHFKPNTLVRLWLDSVGGGPLSQLDLDMTGTHLYPTATTDARGDFFTNFQWEEGRTGLHRLFVVEDGVGGRTLTLPMQASG